jgi:hypothetical protein
MDGVMQTRLCLSKTACLQHLFYVKAHLGYDTTQFRHKKWILGWQDDSFCTSMISHGHLQV